MTGPDIRREEIRHGIGPRLEILVILAVLAPTVVFGLVASSGLGEIRDKSLAERVIIARAAASQVDRHVRDALELLSAVPTAGWSGQIESGGAAQREALRVARLRARLLDHAFLIDPQGRVILEEPTSTAPPFDLAKLPRAAQALATGKPVVVPDQVRADARLLLVVVPLLDWQGRVCGAAVGVSDPSAASWRELFRLLPSAAEAAIELLDEEGSVIAGTRPQAEALHSGYAGALAALQKEHRAGVVTARVGTGHAEVVAYAPMSVLSWGVAVAEPESVIFAPIEGLQRKWILLAVAFATVGAVFAWGVARSVKGPLGQLADAASRIAAGELDRPVPPLKEDEVGWLGRSLDTMRVSLKKTLGDLRSANAEMEQRVVERTRQLNALYQELRVRDEARSRLLRKVITVQEEERKRIAREIHDETCQTIAALGVRLQLVGQAATPEEARFRLDEAKAMATRSLEELHRVMFHLRPSILDDLGLLAAIRWLAQRQLTANGIKTQFDLEEFDRPLPFEVEIAVFRAVQEAISNIVRHAKADAVWIRVGLVGDTLEAEVEDDGEGFAPADVTEPSESGRGLGILGMRERVEQLGGTVRVDSSPGSGTRVLFRVPLPAEAPVAAGD